MVFKGKVNEYLTVGELEGLELSGLLDPVRTGLAILWFTQDGNKLSIDGAPFVFNKDEIICLTEFHQLKEVEIKGARLIKFNRDFYCIYNHDSEVGCKGLLFFGASRLPRFQFKNADRDVFETVFHMFKLEFEQADHLQQEMLQMMLKRFLILCARVYKDQSHFKDLDSQQGDLVREFNYLVEQHFKKVHSVSKYAEMLNKSPKTLSNLFRKISDKSPLQFIHSRRMLEARRLLLHSTSSIKEVAYELGFEDLQTFSRFFKREEGKSPTAFQELNVGKNS